MQKFLTGRRYGLHVVLSFLFTFLLVSVIAFFRWELAVFAFLILLVLLYYAFHEERRFSEELKTYLDTLRYRLKKTGDDVLSDLPIGIVLYNEQKQVEWANGHFLKLVDRKSAIGESLYNLIPELEEVDLNGDEQLIHVRGQTYKLHAKGEERLLCLIDVTEHHDLQKRYQKEKVVLGIIHLDNLDEVSQGMDEQQRAILLSQVTKVISDWATKHNIFLRRISSDKFLTVLDQGTLEQLEETRFDILDMVRGLTTENKIPITLSIGMAAGASSLVEMGRLSQASLDIALGRGGDQAAVRVGNRLSFYGGKTNAVEKRTRVRARVISHALRDLIQDCDQVLIMGHVNPDMDAIGAAIGVLRAVLLNQREGYIVLDKSNPSIQRLMERIEGHEVLSKHFIRPELAVMSCTPRTLVVVVDTHRPSMVIEPKLLQMTKRVMVIDHHRRGEEFIEDPVLLYLEPYASSACELVTELLQYQSERLEMDALEATALLAGIVVDTRSFSFRAGARTFEAASFLRRHGADSALIQQLLKEDLPSFIRKARLVANAEIVFDHIAISAASESERYAQVLIAQAADTLLEMKDIKASFVIGYRQDDQVVISARSLGEINVQVILEKMGGGGHFTHAATQLKNMTIAEAKEKLIELLRQYLAMEGEKR